MADQWAQGGLFLFLPPTPSTGFVVVLLILSVGHLLAVFNWMVVCILSAECLPGHIRADVWCGCSSL